MRVDLTGDTTQKVFDRVLVNLARSAPPIPGFRREKGGNAFMLCILTGLGHLSSKLALCFFLLGAMSIS